MEFTSYKDRTVGLAVDFVNSYGVPGGSEKLAGPDDLAALLRRHQVSYEGAITEADLREIRALRSRVRAAFTAGDEGTATTVINELLAESNAHPYLTNHDGQEWHLHFVPADSPLPRLLTAYAAMGLAIVIADNGFERLKVCDGHECEDVFVDMSKNKSRRFCSAEVCGNRANVAAYRERQRQKAAGKKT